MIAAEAVTLMLMLKNVTLCDTDGVLAINVPTRDEGHDIRVASKDPQGTIHMPQPYFMCQNKMPILSKDKSEVDSVTSHKVDN